MTEVNEMPDNEEFYDKEIAPALLKLSVKCMEKGLAMVALVEFSKGNIGETRVLQPGCSDVLRKAVKLVSPSPAMLSLKTLDASGNVVSQDMIAVVD